MASLTRGEGPYGFSLALSRIIFSGSTPAFSAIESKGSAGSNGLICCMWSITNLLISIFFMEIIA